MHEEKAEMNYRKGIHEIMGHITKNNERIKVNYAEFARILFLYLLYV